MITRVFLITNNLNIVYMTRFLIYTHTYIYNYYFIIFYSIKLFTTLINTTKLISF